MFLLYGLFEPTGELRYIGVTIHTLQRRLSNHLDNFTLNKSKNHKNSWIKSLKQKDLVPVIQIIQEFNNLTDLLEAEKYWIYFFRTQGCRLTNSTDGGEGGFGIKVSEETRLKQRLAHLGQIAWNKGIPRTKAERHLMSKSHGGKPFLCLNNKKTYFTLREATEDLNLPSAKLNDIWKVLNGRRKSVSGYSFMYL